MRPAQHHGATAMLALRFLKSLVEAIDAWASARSLSRSDAMRRLIEAGLRRRGKARVLCVALAEAEARILSEKDRKLLATFVVKAALGPTWRVARHR